MPNFQIVPASSPDVVCHFTVPTGSGAPIEFSVTRMDYIANFQTDWLSALERLSAQLDDAGNPVMADGKVVLDPDKTIEDRDVILGQLRVAGVPGKTITRLAKLTNGELGQIYRHWSEQSQVTVGESQASGI